jgi:hypothetical protein
MNVRRQSNGILVVRRHRGVRHFAVTWHSGLRRHAISIGSERDGWTKESATAAAAIRRRPRPIPVERLEAFELWVTAVELGLAGELPGMWGRLDG